jgi:hypothetical protein
MRYLVIILIILSVGCNDRKSILDGSINESSEKDPSDSKNRD